MLLLLVVVELRIEYFVGYQNCHTTVSSDWSMPLNVCCHDGQSEHQTTSFVGGVSIFLPDGCTTTPPTALIIQVLGNFPSSYGVFLSLTPLGFEKHGTLLCVLSSHYCYISPALVHRGRVLRFLNMNLSVRLGQTAPSRLDQYSSWNVKGSSLSTSLGITRNMFSFQ